ncbi:MCM DNA helicase complex subunit [Cladochytrium tenue]|nr:MCM DNA helicase complex subunit [Cladochytrium tenue]
MFGGVAKNPQGKHRLRGDINVLLLGDPGTAKSQFLKYVEKTSRRAVYTTGQGASAVGLTASVHKDVITKEWTLEGGALVMADKGVCLIDEFDKMNDKDRTSIHEAMEQQSISISKAGIVTTLQARCAVIAAANPVRGRYNAQLPFSMNVELTEPILSRFDVLCVVRDEADPIVDEMLARFVTSSHMRCHPSSAASKAAVADGSAAPAADDAADDEGQEDDTLALDADVGVAGSLTMIIPQELLRKYIVYARDHVQPRMADLDLDKISALYAELRRESLSGGGSIPITVRYIESAVRMAEAFARMSLRDYVRSDDVDRAVAVMVRSFVEAQKKSVKDQFKRKFEKYITVERDNFDLLNHLLSEKVREMVRVYQYRHNRMPLSVEIDLEEFVNDASDLGIHDVHAFLGSREFRRAFVLHRDTNVIEKVIQRPETGGTIAVDH